VIPVVAGDGAGAGAGACAAVVTGTTGVVGVVVVVSDFFLFVKKLSALGWLRLLPA